MVKVENVLLIQAHCGKMKIGIKRFIACTGKSLKNLFVLFHFVHCIATGFHWRHNWPILLFVVVPGRVLKGVHLWRHPPGRIAPESWRSSLLFLPVRSPLEELCFCWTSRRGPRTNVSQSASTAALFNNCWGAICISGAECPRKPGLWLLDGLFQRVTPWSSSLIQHCAPWPSNRSAKTKGKRGEEEKEEEEEQQQ